MGKSLGNYTTIRDALKQYTPMTIRFYILNSHYRSTTDFSTRALDAAARGYGKLQTTLHRLTGLRFKTGGAENPFFTKLADHTRHRFYAAMDDDLNTPAALAVLFDYTRQVNKLLDEGALPDPVGIQAMAGIYHSLGGSILGLFADRDDEKTGNPLFTDELIELLLELRNEARAAKDWKKSDHIRDRLTQLGIILEDHRDGTTDWKQGERN